MDKGGKLFFEIPKNKEIRALLVEAIPSNWQWVDGILRVPYNLIEKDIALLNTGFEIKEDRFDPIRIVGRCEIGQSRHVPEMYDVIVKRKIPGFVTFKTAGFHKPEAFALVQRIIAKLLRENYGGNLTFYKSDYDNSYYDNPARCEMFFEPWEGPPVMAPESGPQPARLKLEWEPRYGGCREHIEKIEVFCRSVLRLREYIPTSTSS